jgi:DNA replication protein DnaC
MNTPDINIDAMLKRLHLANARRTWREVVTRAEKEEWSCRDFLALLVAEEVAHRQQTRIQRVTNRCGFPFLKTVDDFDFTFQSTVKLSLLGSALSPDFVTDGRSLILHGKPGRGKTHIAVAIGYRAIQNGFDALFVTAAELIEDLSVASRDGRLADALGPHLAPHVLVIDEVGYLTYGPDAANVLYHVVSKRYHAMRAMVFTSNKHPSDWGTVLHDNDLAAAIVDRVLERGRLLQLDGPSMRTNHLGQDAAAFEQRQPPAAATGAPAAARPESRPRSAELREGSLDAQAERRLSGSPRKAANIAEAVDLDASTDSAAGSPQVARVSGIPTPEFPEPTPCGDSPQSLSPRSLHVHHTWLSGHPIPGTSSRDPS